MKPAQKLFHMIPFCGILSFLRFALLHGYPKRSFNFERPACDFLLACCHHPDLLLKALMELQEAGHRGYVGIIHVIGLRFER